MRDVDFRDLDPYLFTTVEGQVFLASREADRNFQADAFGRRWRGEQCGPGDGLPGNVSATANMTPPRTVGGPAVFRSWTLSVSA